MKLFKESLNSNGMTLIEVLASIVILGIILTAFFSFFSQSMLISGKVEDNLSAVNLAEKILNKVETKFNDPNFTKPPINSCSDTKGSTYLSNEILGISADDYTVNHKSYYPKISICKEDDPALYQIHVEMYADPANTKYLTELFGYIQ